MVVTPLSSVEDQPIQIRVGGLSPHEVVSLRLVSTDAAGVRWVSTATFAASSAGNVDMSQSVPRSVPHGRVGDGAVGDDATGGLGV